MSQRPHSMAKPLEPLPVVARRVGAEVEEFPFRAEPVDLHQWVRA